MPENDEITQPHSGASEVHQQGDGVELDATQARAGVRRGVSRILVISTALSVLALIIVWAIATTWSHLL